MRRRSARAPPPTRKIMGKMSAVKNQTTCWTRTRSSISSARARERARHLPFERPMARRRRPRPRSTREGNDSANERKHLLAVETTRCSNHGKRSRVGSRGRRRRTQIILYEPIKEGKEEVFENVLFSLGVQSDRVRVRKLSDIDVYHS